MRGNVVTCTFCVILRCVTSQRYLYAVGGNDGSSSLESCERYDPNLNKWSHIADMNKRRAGAGCAELDGVLYAVGTCTLCRTRQNAV